ncbi:DUF2017 domain-containing protein [Actinocorallia libanotica]|uniref:DUF2017 domain-containing protein n=1 Tax=Actinocorallia libanotica TaxID=46162 RepID=A0ABP4CBP6_9ACTN
MSGGFRRSPAGVRMSLDRAEKAVLANLIGQLRQLLGELPKGDPGLAELGISENTEAPADPVLARLFPDGYREDGAASGEFRRYTEASLREGKERDSDLVLRSLGEGGEVTLDPERAQAWLRVLNDLRLALGTRLELGEDDHDRFRDLDRDDPEYAMIVTYDWLTQLQDGLVHCLWG